jgi:hypothetical protein
MAAGRTWLRFAMMVARRGSPIPAGRSIQSLDAECNPRAAVEIIDIQLITIPTKSCRSCGRVLNASPFIFVLRAPSVFCKNCGTNTQLSIVVNLVVTALGFVLSAIVVKAYVNAVQPSDGSSMGVVLFLGAFPIGIGIFMASQVLFGSTCYLLRSFIRDRE